MGKSLLTSVNKWLNKVVDTGNSDLNQGGEVVAFLMHPSQNTLIKALIRTESSNQDKVFII